MMSFLWSLLNIGFYTILAFGGIALAGAIYFGPWSRFIPSGLKGVAAVGCLLVSAFAFGHLDGRSSFKTAIAEANVKLLDQQSDANERIADQAATDAVERAIFIADLQRFNNQYARDLNDGNTTACPVDDVYLDRLHAIIQSTQNSSGTKRIDGDRTPAR